MGWEAEQESIKDPVDYTKRILWSIPVIIVIMAIVLVATHEEKFYNSRVKVRHILVRFPAGDSVQREEALGRALDIKSQLDAGGNFAQLAKAHSEDQTNRDSGGELQWLEHEDAAEAFDVYIWVGEIGAVSDPVETEYGFHLIEVMERHISDAELYQLGLNERLNEMNQSEQ